MARLFKAQPWLAELVEALAVRNGAEDASWFFDALIDRAERWHVLDDADWERIRIGFLTSGLRLHVEAFAAIDAKDPPACWPEVEAACDQVCAAIRSGEGLDEAVAAAKAAESTASVELTMVAAAQRSRPKSRAAARATGRAWAGALLAWAAAYCAAMSAAAAAGEWRPAKSTMWKGDAERLLHLIDLAIAARIIDAEMARMDAAHA